MEREDVAADASRLKSVKSGLRDDDSIRGFAYLESWDQLLAWTPQSVDPVQRANTPLIPRAVYDYEETNEPASKVMLIHDYAGGYNDYEACQGAIVDNESYSCEYLQSVETFIYFSHRLVTIPPPTWINTCHRNGVKVLGTFIVEPGSKNVDLILDEDDRGEFWVATRLAAIAKFYGFDGWLINIEAKFSLLVWSTEKLERFLRQLRTELGDGARLVWYDALTTLNFVWYQNTLNYLNLPFALAAGSVLTNYTWSPDLAKSGKERARLSGLGVENLYYGIDVWAQNVQRGSHKRVTSPVEGGGGTATGLGLRTLAGLGLSGGIFAPGWSFEHFGKHGKAVEKSVWLGEELPTDLDCGCRPDRPHEMVAYRHHGIANYARASPAGSDCYFYTDFHPSFLRCTQGELRSKLGSQSIVPFQTPERAVQSQPCSGSRLRARIGGNFPGCRISVCGKVTDSTDRGRPLPLKLANVNLCRPGSYILTAAYRSAECPDGPFSIGIKRAHTQDFYEWKPLQVSGDQKIKSLTWPLEIPPSGAIVAIYVRYEPSSAQNPPLEQTLIHLQSLTLLPAAYEPPRCGITKPRIAARGEGESSHRRLVWDISTQAEDNTVIPLSATTGSFAFFRIRIDEVSEAQNSDSLPASIAEGRAYAKEYILCEEVVQKWKEANEVRVCIQGVGFEGSLLASSEIKITWSDWIDDLFKDEEDDWIMVSRTVSEGEG